MKELIPVLLIVVVIAAIVFAVAYGMSQNRKAEAKQLEAEKTDDPILAELRQIRRMSVENRIQLGSIKWAVRGVGLLLAIIVFFGFKITS